MSLMSARLSDLSFSVLICADPWLSQLKEQLQILLTSLVWTLKWFLTELQLLSLNILTTDGMSILFVEII